MTLPRARWSLEARVDYAMLERRVLREKVWNRLGGKWASGELVVVRPTFAAGSFFNGPLPEPMFFDIVGEHGETSAWGLPRYVFGDAVDA